MSREATRLREDLTTKYAKRTKVRIISKKILLFFVSFAYFVDKSSPSAVIQPGTRHT
jgi:hypothetical protein